MKKKALIIIAIYLALIAFSSNNEQYEERIENYQFTIENSENIEKKIIEIISSEQKAIQQPANNIVTLDLTSPSYTSLLLSESEPIVEGTEVIVQSTTTSMGMGVDSGSVDFVDLELYNIENDTTSASIYSNKFGIRVNIPQSLTIYGFIVDITPTIREDINYYIRESLGGPDLTSGIVSGYLGNSAHVNGDMLHVLFSYSGSGGTLSLDAGSDYYFVLEPTLSTSDSFFELKESDNNPDNVGIYNWSGSAYEEIISDVNIYLVTQENLIDGDVNVNGSGEAECSWISSSVGDHSLFAIYKGSTYYSESFASILTKIIPAQEIYIVSMDPVYVNFEDLATFSALVKEDEFTFAVDKTVIFSYSEDDVVWINFGSAVTNIAGIAELDYQFELEPGNYSLRAEVNELSYCISFVLISPKNLVWYNIDFYGNYRNNPLYPNDVKITTVIELKDEDNNVVANMDFELWYKIDSEYERIPHYYRTNASGMTEIVFSVEGLTVGTFQDSHYFRPADYETNYIGNSNYGDTIVDKGYLEIEFTDFTVTWSEDLTLTAKITSIGDDWENANVDFQYFDNGEWHSIGQAMSNSTGVAEIVWDNVNLNAGIYSIRAKITESAYFFATEDIESLEVERKGIIIYIINEGEPKGNGEEINIEYTSAMNLVFYVTYDDGTPIPNIALEIKGRLLGDLFYESMGFVSTNATGYAEFDNYEELVLVGFQYACIAEITESGQHEKDQLYFKLNLTKCTPIIVTSDHNAMVGSYFEFSAYVFNTEGLPLMDVQVQFIVNGIIFQGTTDRNGLVRIQVAPQIAAGNYLLECRVVEDDYFNTTQEFVTLTLNKGIPYFTILDAYVKVDGYLTLKAYVIDSLGRPIPNLAVMISFSGWSEILTADEYGVIQYTFSVSGYDVGNYLLILTFEGDESWIASSEIGNLLIYQFESEMELQIGSIVAIYQDEIYFETLLTTDTGTPLEGRAVNFVIYLDDGSYIILGQNVTDASGIAKYRTILDILPGNYEWGALFTGEVDYGPSSQAHSLIVEKASVIMVGSDFDAIIDSTATFSVTLLNYLGLPVSYQQIDLFIWANNSWILLGLFVTEEDGIAYITFNVPETTGVYYLKVQYSGNEYYKSNYLPIEIVAVTPPPKIAPTLILDTDTPIIADHQVIMIEISVPNAVAGAAIEINVYVNTIYLDTILIVNGNGFFNWNSSEVGIYDITFITVEDSVYLTSIEDITIEVILNNPPKLLSYSYVDYLCEGELFNIEAILEDTSGILTVWTIINGTKYQMENEGDRYFTTIYMLSKGIHQLSIQAEDQQGNIATFDLDSLNVYARKTQVIKYHLNASIVEVGTEFTIEALIYSEKSVQQISLIINETEYQMILDYQIDAQRGVWRIAIDNLEIGNYIMKIKIVETVEKIYYSEIQELLIIIPDKPVIELNDWLIEIQENGDYISGNITISSFYGIISVQIWIDGIEFTVIKISEGLYYYYGLIDHSKSHTMTVKIIDSKNRILESELPLTIANKSNIVTISLIVTSIVLFALIGVGIFFTSKYLKKQSDEEQEYQIDVPEIEVEDTGEQKENEELTELEDEFSRILDDTEEEFTLFPEIKQRNQPKSAKLVKAQARKSADNKKEEKPVDLVDVSEEDENLKQVKEYLEKVKEDGTLEYANGNGSNGKKLELDDSIDKLTSLTTEIDYRVLPKDEQQAVLEQQESDESTVFDLKTITEEIEQTFTKNR